MVTLASPAVAPGELFISSVNWAGLNAQIMRDKGAGVCLGDTK